MQIYHITPPFLGHHAVGQYADIPYYTSISGSPCCRAICRYTILNVHYYTSTTGTPCHNDILTYTILYLHYWDTMSPQWSWHMLNYAMSLQNAPTGVTSKGREPACVISKGTPTGGTSKGVTLCHFKSDQLMSLQRKPPCVISKGTPTDVTSKGVTLCHFKRDIN